MLPDIMPARFVIQPLLATTITVIEWGQSYVYLTYMINIVKDFYCKCAPCNQAYFGNSQWPNAGIRHSEWPSAGIRHSEWPNAGIRNSKHIDILIPMSAGIDYNIRALHLDVLLIR